MLFQHANNDKEEWFDCVDVSPRHTAQNIPGLSVSRFCERGLFQIIWYLQLACLFWRGKFSCCEHWIVMVMQKYCSPSQNILELFYHDTKHSCKTMGIIIAASYIFGVLTPFWFFFGQNSLHMTRGGSSRHAVHLLYSKIRL